MLRSKTILFALALAVFGVVEAQLQLFVTYLPQWGFGAASIIISAIVAALRVVTTLPLSEKRNAHK